ncbi:SixA phosphatase family protein [Umboniibacter marinipuniceus]|uniref:Phosphohistidine phosphatase SixA n=1 Tax=Umboniibacter marinipuniceus TaxID=569599 RepID=A0A3M0AI87_9GAMM|nr:phosphoglycerate mutase family protein [Umboniibacter marinipuniceus]RMA82305.1 phosphohistidine phosphatase SixA [Umboniibacter marinipuniceus]
MTAPVLTPVAPVRSSWCRILFKPLVALVPLAVTYTLSFAPSASADIYLVRHAEKLGGEDPALTFCGEQRARWLANYFASASVTAVFTTNYVRTTDTARPVAQYHQLKLQTYDPRALDALAKKLDDYTGDVVVVGHSNTTPQLASLLASAEVDDLDETHYNRLYRITREGELRVELQTFECVASEDSSH